MAKWQRITNVVQLIIRDVMRAGVTPASTIRRHCRTVRCPSASRNSVSGDLQLPGLLLGWVVFVLVYTTVFEGFDALGLDLRVLIHPSGKGVVFTIAEAASNMTASQLLHGNVPAISNAVSTTAVASVSVSDATIKVAVAAAASATTPSSLLSDFSGSYRTGESTANSALRSSAKADVGESPEAEAAVLANSSKPHVSRRCQATLAASDASAAANAKDLADDDDFVGPRSPLAPCHLLNFPGLTRAACEAIGCCWDDTAAATSARSSASYGTAATGNASDLGLGATSGAAGGGGTCYAPINLAAEANSFSSGLPGGLRGSSGPASSDLEQRYRHDAET
eukprot:TRINITY_DN25632_c0_g1_i2.p1 TRINITY_DN25632_c0_g1~~TRINITY_DN25632_c0_g1_i2.p1  ORF type:complete len:345 (+),score=52.90 TRINITY_DN25632_c0_g1_i2:23-1036(+)